MDTASSTARRPSRVILGEESERLATLELAGDARLLEKLEELAAVMRFVPAEALVTYFTELKRAIERRQTEQDRDRAILEVLTPDHVPTPARILQLRRNAEARDRLIDEFGLLSSAELAELRHANTENPSSVPTKWVKDGRIFWVLHGGERRYPGFQFDEWGRPLAALRPLMAVLSPLFRGWELALWFTGANSTLEGRRPIDVFRDDPEGALVAAQHELDKATSW